MLATSSLVSQSRTELKPPVDLQVYAHVFFPIRYKLCFLSVIWPYIADLITFSLQLIISVSKIADRLSQSSRLLG